MNDIVSLQRCLLLGSVGTIHASKGLLIRMPFDVPVHVAGVTSAIGAQGTHLFIRQFCLENYSKGSITHVG